MAEEIAGMSHRPMHKSQRPPQGSSAPSPDCQGIRATGRLLLFFYIPLSFVLTLFFPFQFNASFLHYSDMPGTVLVRSRYVALSQPEPAATPGADVPMKSQHIHTWLPTTAGRNPPKERSRCLSQPR